MPVGTGKRIPLLDYQHQYCFLFSFPLGCQKYPGKVSDSCISLSELGLGLETEYSEELGE